MMNILTKSQARACCGLVLMCLGSTTNALMKPHYLDVPHFKSCLQTHQVHHAQFWCFPQKKPAKCPDSSWKQLRHLTVTGDMTACRYKVK